MKKIVISLIIGSLSSVAFAQSDRQTGAISVETDTLVVANSVVVNGLAAAKLFNSLKGHGITLQTDGVTHGRTGAGVMCQIEDSTLGDQDIDLSSATAKRANCFFYVDENGRVSPQQLIFSH